KNSERSSPGSSFRNGPMRRVALPSGGSILITSAPSPASSSPQYSARSSAISMTRSPASIPGPASPIISPGPLAIAPACDMRLSLSTLLPISPCASSSATADPARPAAPFTDCGGGSDDVDRYPVSGSLYRLPPDAHVLDLQAKPIDEHFDTIVLIGGHL